MYVKTKIPVILLLIAACFNLELLILNMTVKKRCIDQTCQYALSLIRLTRDTIFIGQVLTEVYTLE